MWYILDLPGYSDGCTHWRGPFLTEAEARTHANGPWAVHSATVGQNREIRQVADEDLPAFDGRHHKLFSTVPV